MGQWWLFDKWKTALDTCSDLGVCKTRCVPFLDLISDDDTTWIDACSYVIFCLSFNNVVAENPKNYNSLSYFYYLYFIFILKKTLKLIPIRLILNWFLCFIYIFKKLTKLTWYFNRTQIELQKIPQIADRAPQVLINNT